MNKNPCLPVTICALGSSGILTYVRVTGTILSSQRQAVLAAIEGDSMCITDEIDINEYHQHSKGGVSSLWAFPQILDFLSLLSDSQSYLMSVASELSYQQKAVVDFQ